MDSTDRKLILLLQQDSRLPNAQLAERLNICFGVLAARQGVGGCWRDCALFRHRQSGCDGFEV